MNRLNPSSPRAPHLTELQLDDALLGDLAPSASAHLAGCGPCSARLEQARAPLADFAALTLAWSERRSATLPLRSALDPASLRRPRLAWAVAASCALALGIAVPALHLGPFHLADAPTAALPALAATDPAATDSAATNPAVTDSEVTAPAAGQLAANSSDEQISRDNQMLREIDSELDAANASPASLVAFGDLAQAPASLGQPATLRLPPSGAALRPGRLSPALQD
jgi:hypothetical protein